MKPKIKVAYLLTYPIQYQTPLLKILAKSSIVDLTVFYRSKMSLRSHTVPYTNVQIKWDVPLLDGYNHKFLKCIGNDSPFSFFRPFNAGLYSALRKGKFDVLWVHGYTDFYSLYAIFICKVLGIKVIVRGESTLMSRHNNALKNLLRTSFFKFLNKVVNKFLYVGTLNKQFYKHYSIPEKKLVFCPYTVDNEYFQQIKRNDTRIAQMRQQLNLSEGRPIILFASRMIARKNQADLLQAYIKLSKNGEEPFPYLIFIGDGEPKQALEHNAKQTGWSSIKFLGYKNQSELPLFYTMADVFVLPSERENWGLVINEAMSAGCAIIVSHEIGGGVDLVKNDVNGFIFPTGDIQALSLALQHTSQDMQKCLQMGQESIRIIGQWGIKQTASGVEQACQQVVNNE